MKRGGATKLFRIVFQYKWPPCKAVLESLGSFTLQNLKGGGRKAKEIQALARMIVQEAKQNPRITLKAVLNNLGNAGISVSR